MSRHPNNKNSAQALLFHHGQKELGDAANVLPDIKVRRAGLKRIGKRVGLRVAQTTVAVGLVVGVGKPMLDTFRTESAHLEQDDADARATREADQTAEERKDIESFVAINPGASEEVVAHQVYDHKN